MGSAKQGHRAHDLDDVYSRDIDCEVFYQVIQRTALMATMVLSAQTLRFVIIINLEIEQ